MKTNIEMIPCYKITYIRNTGIYGVNNALMMEALKKWASEKHLMDDNTIILGIPQDDPAVIKAEDCRYDTCIVVSDAYRIEGEFVKEGAVSGGKYLIFEIDHTAEAVQRAWTDAFVELNKSGFIMDYSRPVMERYATKMIANHMCELCIPIC